MQVGTSQLTYNVKDKAGNTAISQVRTVNVTDTRKPIILLIGSNMAIEAGSPFTDPGCRVLDEVCCLSIFHVYFLFYAICNMQMMHFAHVCELFFSSTPL